MDDQDQDQDPKLEVVPETAEEVLRERPGYVGTLEENENRLLQSLRQSSSQIVQEIGQHEVLKARLLGNLQEVEQKASALVAHAAQRFGVEGHTWTVTPEGEMFLPQGQVPQKG